MPMSNAISKGLVSIIIPAFNEEKNIAICLESLKKQSYKLIEIILVDDISKDNTTDVAKKISLSLKLNLKIISPKIHSERGVVRNLGAKEARGEYLLFIDADMKLSENVVEDCVNLLKKDSEIKAAIIPEQSFGKGFWSRCRALEKKCYIGDPNIEAARFFEKQAFWDVGGWDSKMISGEDWDLTRRVRAKFLVGRVESYIFHNEGRLTLWKVTRKKFYYASRSKNFLKRYPLKWDGILFFVFRPAYLRNWRLIVSDPLHGIGMFILKFIEVVAGALGFLASQLLSPV